jgi:hypothetical protein
MARVLALTAGEQLPSWAVNVYAMPDTPIESDIDRRQIIANSRKLWAWNNTIRSAEDGERILLIDADAAILLPLDDVWDLDFDLAYTKRPSTAKFPFNGGVLFVRVSNVTRAFFDLWERENARMLVEPAHHRKWQARYGGINQASFGYLTHSRSFDLKLHALPCSEWNCEDSGWSQFDPDTTRILHIKSALRLACFLGVAERATGLGPLAKIWREFDRRASGALTRTA